MGGLAGIGKGRCCVCFSDDRLVHLGRWVGLRGVGYALAGLDGLRTGTNCRAIHSSVVLLAALRLMALADLVTYRCTKGFQMIDVALQQRSTLTVRTRGRA